MDHGKPCKFAGYGGFHARITLCFGSHPHGFHITPAEFAELHDPTRFPMRTISTTPTTRHRHEDRAKHEKKFGIRCCPGLPRLGSR